MKATKVLPSAPAASAVPGRVSVIVPTRNSSRTIEACLASVCAQSYPDVELVVVDNGSTDGTPDVARPFAHRVLRAGPERSAQRNAGAAACTGEFLVFVDSDMVLSPQVAEEVVREFRRYPRVQALVVPERSVGQGYWARCRILEKDLYLGDADVEAARAFRRAAFDEAGGYDEGIQVGGEDWDLPERVADAGGTIGRVGAEILHDEGRLSLITDLRKKLYYGRGFARYARRSPGRALRKVVRGSSLRRFPLLWRDPLHGIGLVLMKLLELAAVSAGILLSHRQPRGPNPREDPVEPSRPSTFQGNPRATQWASSSFKPMLRRRWARFGARLFQMAMEENLRNMSDTLAPLSSASELRVLDLGCWDGDTVRKYVPVAACIFGIELDHGAARNALRRDVRVVRADLDGPFPFRDGSFDVVTSNQVIEHLCDTENFLKEIRRVLRPGGLAVVSTENMASWHNIAALLLGWQAFSLTNVSHEHPGIGNPLANLRGNEPLHEAWEHRRIFSHRGLIELVQIHGFRDARILGAGYYPLSAGLGRLDPRHAAFITVVGSRG